MTALGYEAFATSLSTGMWNEPRIELWIDLFLAIAVVAFRRLLLVELGSTFWTRMQRSDATFSSSFSQSSPMPRIRLCFCSGCVLINSIFDPFLYAHDMEWRVTARAIPNLEQRNSRLSNLTFTKVRTASVFSMTSIQIKQILAPVDKLSMRYW